jgi:hypothetical protein
VTFDTSIYKASPWSERFHMASADEVMGGGSAGPGKSLTMLWNPIVRQAIVEHARMTQQIPTGYGHRMCELIRDNPIRQGESAGHALHMRRTMPQLRETIDRSLRMFPKIDPGAKYQKEEHRWIFSSGYKLTFGHCKEESDTENYLSQQYSELDIDEAYQFTLNMYEELDGRVRSSDKVLRATMGTRLMSNPAPGWLKQRFVDPEPKGNVIHRITVRDPRTGETKIKRRLFLPATLDDNPDAAFVEEYKFKLLSKPAHIRARYLYGDWSSMEGAYFEEDWNTTVHVVEPFKIPRSWPKFRAMDWGFKAPGVMGWFALSPDEELYLFYEFNFRLMKDEEVCKTAIEIEKRFGFWDPSSRCSRLTGVADTQLWEERGDSGKSKAQVFAEMGMPWEPADKASIQRNAERIAERLRDYDDKRKPGLMVFRTCAKTIEMFAGIGVDANDSTIPDKKSPLKHWFDMNAYGAAKASQGSGAVSMAMHAFDREEQEDDFSPASAGRGGGYGYGG